MNNIKGQYIQRKVNKDNKEYTFHSIRISSKNNDAWESSFIDMRLTKNVPIPVHKQYINITKYFIVARNNEPVIVVQELEIIETKELSKEEKKAELERQLKELG